jgi:hypothetical protein
VIGKVKNYSQNRVIVLVSSCRTINDEFFSVDGRFFYVFPNSEEDISAESFVYPDSCNLYIYFFDADRVDSLFSKTVLSANKIYRKTIIANSSFSKERALKKNINFSIDSSMVVYYQNHN